MNIRELLDKNFKIQTIHTKEIQQENGKILHCETVKITGEKHRKFDVIFVSENDDKAVVICKG